MRMNKERKLLSSNPAAVAPSQSLSTPYPSHPNPTPGECRAIRDLLLHCHGFPQQFAKFRKDRESSLPSLGTSVIVPGASYQVAEKSDFSAGETVRQNASPVAHEESVLDGLISTILSQNTTDANSGKAFTSLKSAFPNWQDVLAGEKKHLEDAIRCCGLAVTKASYIRNILSSLLEKRGKICLEYLHCLSVDDVKAELRSFKGVGPKTVACVLMFHLHKDDFPVDTHVFRIAKAIGWVPAGADRVKAYLHLNCRIPNELKFDLNCLLVTHGKVCRKCTQKGGINQRSAPLDFCPFTDYCNSPTK